MNSGDMVKITPLAILIPVFNDPQGLRRSLDSLRAARQPAGTVTIVVDDGSTEPVQAAETDSQPGVVVVRLPQNSGIEHALNAGLAEARRRGARYIARLDAGDTIAPERLERQLAVLETRPDVGLVGSSARFEDESGQTLFVFLAPEDDATIRRRMHINCCILHPTVMLRDSVLEIVGDYSTRYPAAEDYELFFRMLGHCKGTCLPDVLVSTEASRKGISVKRRRAQLVSRLRVQQHFFDARCVESYFGIAMTLALLAVPQRMVLALKTQAGHSSY